MYKVFLVDDEIWSLIAIKSMIDWKEQGFEICGEAEDGEQAIKRILDLKPDLVISDIRMPGLDGLQLLEMIRNSGLKAQVLLVSGYTDFEYARQALMYGCVGYLVKPVEEEELLRYLRKIQMILSEERMRMGQSGEASDAAGQDSGGYYSDKMLMQEIVGYIREHYAEGLSLQVLAGQFGMSESYISSLIKKKTGKNFGEHLTETRIRNAQNLLRTTNDSIEEIARKVGYPDYYYFSKVYKKTTGISPSAYRKQL